MDKKKLDKKLDEWIKKLPQEDRKCLLAHLSSLKSIYPFNEYEYRLMYLLDKKIINFREYENLRDAYVNANPYLNLYNISPRVFGEIWAQQHLVDLDSRFNIGFSRTKKSKTIPREAINTEVVLNFKLALLAKILTSLRSSQLNQISS